MTTNFPSLLRLAICSGAATLLLAALASGMPPAGDRAKEIHIQPEKELFITHPAVVDSERARYPGPWSFGKLVEELVGKEAAPDVVRKWLETWTHPVKVNGQTVPVRPLFDRKLIAAWEKRDGYDSLTCETWKPKLENAPFRLLAIVNRVDLSATSLAGTQESVEAKWKAMGRGDLFTQLLARTTTATALPKAETSPDAREAGIETTTGFGGYGGTSASARLATRSSGLETLPAGEGRLIFGATDADGKPLAGEWTVIFEYSLIDPPKVPMASNASKMAGEVGPQLVPTDGPWARRWHALGQYELGDPLFGAALESVTSGFTMRAPASNVPPGISQIRTNEAAFGPGREFRQYILSGEALLLTPLPMTPAPEFMEKHSREQRALANFLHIQEPLIRGGISGLPATIEVGNKVAPLLAARALIPANEPAFYWDPGTIVHPDARRLSSLVTCNGCHAGETGCRTGLHVRPRAAGEEAELSEFLRVREKGLRINDPATGGTKVEYHEMEDRMAIFAALLEPKERARLNALRDVLRTRMRRTH